MTRSSRKTLSLLLPAACIGGLTIMPAAGAGSPKGPLDEKRIEAVAAMLDEHPAGFGRPISDRAAWGELAKGEAFHKTVAQAEKLLKTPIPDQPDDLFLEFTRTGNRSRWQKVSGERRGSVKPLVLAECIENKGRFISAFEELVRVLCAERTWVMSAHDKSLKNFNGKGVDIDLGSSALGWSLAEADYLLGDKLGAETRQLIRDNVQRRILTPFHDMAAGKQKENSWMRGTNNWNAVCLAGVAGSALAQIEPRRERALFIVAAEEYSKNFLSGFTSDGYCSEGLGYWDYGFGHYLMLSEAILQATKGGVDLMARPKVRPPATFAVRIGIINGVYPAFADCSISAHPSARALWFVSRRFEMGLRQWEKNDMVTPVGALFESMMYSFPNSASKTPPATEAAEGPGLRSWFDQAGILICRPKENSPCRFGVALKGGHNAEHHNHNDVGSYVAVSGAKALLLDPGSETYTARTFSARRYESNVLNSYGHPVPLVSGNLQKTGREARARVIRTDFTDATDTLVLDIKSAYDVKELEKLERTFVYSREGAGSLTVSDAVVFSSPQSFGSALITYDDWQQLTPASLTIQSLEEGIRVDIQTTGSDFEIKAEEIKEDVHSPTPPTRLGINLKQPVTKGTITVRITPLEIVAAR